jgi:hypothetical protein
VHLTDDRALPNKNRLLAACSRRDAPMMGRLITKRDVNIGLIHLNARINPAVGAPANVPYRKLNPPLQIASLAPRSTA